VEMWKTFIEALMLLQYLNDSDLLPCGKVPLYITTDNL